ncbi:MAG: hypothetical protein KF857_07130 [Fimbriimonadaceae bacterium]|nr:hypothetical protein [Fimbriimonadaceae bacterium]
MYESKIPYQPERIHAAAMYCSDGRVGAQFDDFLDNGLLLPRYDRLTLPGGPSCLAGYPELTVAEKGIVEELQFLVDVHELKRVVLIAHQGCAFYSSRLGLAEPRMELVQRADLVRAAAYIYRVSRIPTIDAYFARNTDGTISFEPVEV